MGKLISRYRKGENLLKIILTTKGLKGKLYEFKWDTSVSPNKCSLVLISAADFYEKDRDNTEYRVREYFGMGDAKKVTSDNYIDINHRVIWTNNDYFEWKQACMEFDGMSDEETSFESYDDYCDICLSDERENLNIKVDGYIVCFADLGLWNGRYKGSKVIGTNVKDILSSNCDYLDWYCDRYNVRCTGSHHDGTNYMLYRVAKSKEDAERLANAIAYGDMTEEQFRKATRSLRPYVANVYGW